MGTGKIDGDELFGDAENTGERFAGGVRNHEKVEAQLLAHLAQLILDRGAGVAAVVRGEQQLEAGFERRILAENAQQVAVARFGLRLHAGDGFVSLAERSLRLIPDGTLDEDLDGRKTTEQ